MPNRKTIGRDHHLNDLARPVLVSSKILDREIYVIDITSYNTVHLLSMPDGHQFHNST